MTVRFSFNDVAWQFIPDIHHTLTVEEFPGVETTSRLWACVHEDYGYLGSAQRNCLCRCSLSLSVFYRFRWGSSMWNQALWVEQSKRSASLPIEISKVREVHEIHEIHCLIIEILSPISEIISSKSMLNIEIHKIHDIHLSQLPSIHLLATKWTTRRHCCRYKTLLNRV